jgi:hypothetical protein
MYFTYPRVAILLAATVFFCYRLFFLPGLNFNSKIWDDEVDWEKDFQQRNFFEWISHRDAPGYFVFLPRLILAACHAFPDFMFEVNLRIILIVLNLTCVYFASKLVISQDKEPKDFFMVFCCFSSIYIADLNYLHNISYYFIFPILFLMQRISRRVSKYHLGNLTLIVLLIGKPIVAILMMLLIAYLLLKSTFPRGPLWFLIIYNTFYLGTYFLLPNRWSTPVNSDLSTLKPLILNIPWVFGMVLFPVIYFGLNGFLHFLELDLLRTILGISLYVTPLIFLALFSVHPKKKISSRVSSHRLHISMLLLVSSYVLVYLNFDSYWIKNFPLYTLNVPQDLWLRWSSLIPILGLAVLWEIGKLFNIQRWIRIVFWLVMLQEFVFQFVAYSWLLRQSI